MARMRGNKNRLELLVYEITMNLPNEAISTIFIGKFFFSRAISEY